jgi:exosortase K
MVKLYRLTVNRMWETMPFIMGIAVVVGLKYHYSMAAAGDLLWILRPTAELAGWVCRLPFVFDPVAGFVNESRRIVIAPACGGVNFMIIAFAMAFFSFAGTFGPARARWTWLGWSFIGSYGLTLCVNTVRICLSIATISHGIYWGVLTPDRIHRIEGVVVYFFFLTLFYGGLRRGVMLHDKGCGHDDHENGRFAWIVPLFWYLLVALAVPVFTGNFRSQGGHYVEHGAVVIGCCTVIAGLYHGAGRIFRRTKGFHSGICAGYQTVKEDHGTESAYR